MAVIAPTPIDAAPAVPSSADGETTFDAAYEAFYGWEKNKLQSQANALASNVYNNASEAVEAASTAITEADLAMGYRNTANSAASTAVTAAGTATTKAAEADASAVQASKLILGAKSSPPTVDNQGAALLVGANYYDTTLGKWRAWSGTAWNDPVNTVGAVSKTGDTMTGNLDVPSLNGGQIAGFRNKIINGNLLVNQRAYVSGAATTAGQYTLDRWKVTGTGGVTFSTTANKTTITIPAGQTLQQVIEGLNLQSGTYVLSWGGTAQGRINGGTYGSSGTVTATLTGGTNATVEFNSGTLEYVMLEKGTAPTAFEHRQETTEKTLCKRYYQAFYGSGAGVALAARGAPGSGSALWLSIVYPVEMRAAPTATVVGSWTVSNCGQPTVSQAGTTNLTLLSNATAAGDAFYYSAASNVGITLASEL